MTKLADNPESSSQLMIFNDGGSVLTLDSSDLNSVFWQRSFLAFFFPYLGDLFLLGEEKLSPVALPAVTGDPSFPPLMK